MRDGIVVVEAGVDRRRLEAVRKPFDSRLYLVMRASR
jgi:hypothetical protein